MIEYTYRVLRYVHDPAAGEMLNIGVILYAPSVSYLDTSLDTHYERLSKTFLGFNGENFRQVLHRFEMAVGRYREQQRNVLPLSEPPVSVEQITRHIWPDGELSFRFGPVLGGVTASPEEELSAIFERMVLSQYPREDKLRRTDEEVWAVYKKPLVEKAAVSVLQPKVIATSDFQLTFPYAFKNEKWHVLQPLSLDYARPEGIQRKAAQWLGNGTALKEQDELTRVYLLLGRPQLQSHKASYEKAKHLLDKIPISHEILEENEALDFARTLVQYMRQHKILT